MRKNAFKAALCAAFALGAGCQADAQTLKATLSDVASDTIMVSLHDADGKTQSKLDTIVARNGAFEFNLKGTNSTRAYFYIKGVDAQGRRSYRQFGTVLVPGEKAVMNGTTENYTLTGSAFYTEYGKIDARLCELDRKRFELMNKYRPVLTDNNADKAAQEKARSEYAAAVSKIDDERKAIIIDYIKGHADSEVSAALVAELGMRGLEEGVKLLGEKARNGRTANIYKSIQADIQKEKEYEAKSKALEGKQAPTFTLNDINGKPLKLESLRGKYVVLDFWGSWCGWCIKGIPEMKKAYAKHKGKLEILGIDCRDTEAKWKAAVAKHELPWLNVRNAGNPDVSKMYYIMGYPTKIVVDPQGKVAKIIVGEDPAFYTYLDEILK